MSSCSVAESSLSDTLDTLVEENQQEYVDGVEAGRVSVNAIADATPLESERVEEIARSSDKFRTDRMAGKLWIEKVVQ
jgi:hypothetical protein